MEGEREGGREGEREKGEVRRKVSVGGKLCEIISQPQPPRLLTAFVNIFLFDKVSCFQFSEPSYQH